jgi:hypothetical protein
MEQRKATQGGADGVFRQAVVLIKTLFAPLPPIYLYLKEHYNISPWNDLN